MKRHLPHLVPLLLSHGAARLAHGRGVRDLAPPNSPRASAARPRSGSAARDENEGRPTHVAEEGRSVRARSHGRHFGGRGLARRFWICRSRVSVSKTGDFPRYIDSHVRALTLVQQKLGLRLLSHHKVGRHSVASQAVTGGESIKAVQAQLGHRSEQSTDKYSHLGLGAQRRLIEAPRPVVAPHEQVRAEQLTSTSRQPQKHYAGATSRPPPQAFTSWLRGDATRAEYRDIVDVREADCGLGSREAMSSRLLGQSGRQTQRG